MGAIGRNQPPVYVAKMATDYLSEFESALRGRGCTVQRRENDWSFSFGDGYGISVSVPWRVVRNGGIAHGHRDDGQRFGLPEPVDGEARANELFAGRRVEAVELDRVTADLRLIFDNETRLDIFNDSSGYEGWQAQLQVGERLLSFVGLGGGDIAIF
jgi:hypothetical protein